MKPSEMLHNMCTRDLSNADVKAICKNRGFSNKEAASRTLFENFFLSDIGIEKVLTGLSNDEVYTLHVLKILGKPVSITFFERIYETGSSDGWGITFTKEYQNVFKRVKSDLVRKGVLLIAEDYPAISYQTTKMERWRFAFPTQFEPFLPSLFDSVKQFDNPGNDKPDLLRQTILASVRGDGTAPLVGSKTYDLTLAGGELHIGEREFRIKHMKAWQRLCWRTSLPKSEEHRYTSDTKYVSPIKAVRHALSQLGANEWIFPDQLTGLLKIFCGENHPSARTICEKGWQWGCLSQQNGQKKYYRLPPEQAGDGMHLDPGSYLQIDENQLAVIVDLKTIPFESLEFLTGIAVLRAQKDHLVILPNLIKLGNAGQNIRDHALIQWLDKHSPTFNQCFKKVNQRRGKYLVHQNLMIARVQDLSLKVSIQKSLTGTGKVVLFPNDYIAFPTSLLPKVEQLVAKSGFAIKRIQAGIKQ